jgi:regulator of protease activity HflC (stomatin/prohibitin superfamily)
MSGFLGPSRRTIGWAAAAVVILVIIALFEPLIIVGVGYRGVLLNFGAVQQQSLQPGLHVVTPIAHSIVRMDTRIQLTWDGKLPNFLGASTPVPFIGVDGKSP